MIQIQDFPNYYVTPEGFIYSERRGIILKGGVDKDGYIMVTLCDRGRRRTAKVHREVAKAYVPNPDNLPVTNHIDGIKTNNHPSNLEWTTVSGNTKHAYKLGALNQQGESNNACKYQDTIVERAMELSQITNLSIADIARYMGLKYATAYSYIKGIRRTQSSETIPKGSTPEANAGGSGAATKVV